MVLPSHLLLLIAFLKETVFTYLVTVTLELLRGGNSENNMVVQIPLPF